MKKWKQAMLLVSGIGFSNLGNWIYFVAINISILDLTGSAAAVAGLFVIRPIAMLLTNVWAGSLIDRSNIRRLMIFVDLVRGLLILLIPLLSSLWMIYGIMLIISIFGSFFGPSSSVYITKLIPEENRQRFNSILSMANSGAFLLGPAVSGVLIMTIGTDFCILFNAASFICCAFFIFLLPDVNEESPDIRKPISMTLFIEDWKAVSQFVKQAAYFVSVFVFFQCAMLIGYAIDSQEATFIKLNLHLTESDYGNIISLTGVGSLAGSFLAAFISKKISYRWFMSIGALLSTLFYITFYSSFNFVTAAVSFVLLGFFMAFASSGYATFFQKYVPISIMGRFASLSDVTQGIIQILLTLLVGLLSDMISLQLVCLIFSGLAFILCLFLCTKVFSASKSGSLSL
ncbi:MFS transporter [Paenibacillus larvae]